MTVSLILVFSWLALPSAWGQDLATPAMTPSVSRPVTTLPKLPAFLDQGLAIAAPSFGGIATPASCPRVGPWEMQVDMTGQVLTENAAEKAEDGLRPISVSATGSIDTPRFDVVWLQDDLGANQQWDLRHGLSAFELAAHDQALVGCRMIAVDAYGFSADDLRYIAVWACDGIEAEFAVAQSRPDFLDIHEAMTAAGLSPIWVDGHLDTEVLDAEFVSYSGIWTNDGGDRTLEIDLAESTDDEPLWNDKTDDDYRMIRLSQYFTPIGGQSDLQLITDPEFERRYAAIWEKIPDACTPVNWEAFRAQRGDTLSIKATAQSVPDFTDLDPQVNEVNEFKLLAEQLPGQFLLRNASGLETAQLRTINVTNGPPQQGDLLYLRALPGERIRVNSVDHAGEGNIRLFRSNAVAQECAPFSCQGQSMLLDDWLTSLVLQWNAGTGEWHEVQRNNLSPGQYMPIAIDNFSRRYSTVWLKDKDADADPLFRRFLTIDAVSPTMFNNASTDDQNAHLALRDLDDVVQDFMEERLIPNAILGVAVDGRLVASRGYVYATPREIQTNSIEPDALLRIASISKPLTAVATMRLVDQARLDLDQPIGEIPGIVDAIGSMWNSDVYATTPRQLLNHLGGWDRDLSPDFTITENFEICGAIEPEGLPTSLDRILAYAMDYAPDHDPGAVYAYSNFGYTILGRVIEAVTGSTYESFVRDEILLPIGADSTVLTPAGPGGNLAQEVRYFEPNYPMTASVFGFPAGEAHPLREECNRAHADIVPTPYGEYNIRPMDSHGGWLSTAPDLLRIVAALEDPDFIQPRTRAAMWSRPVGRETRVYTTSPGTVPVDRSFDARLTDAVNPILLFADSGDRLVIGKGYTTFGSITFDLASFAAPSTEPETGETIGYDLVLEYWSNDGWTELSEDDHQLDDIADNIFTPASNANETTIAFEPPEDWVPVILPFFDPVQPRYYLRIASDTEPDTAAEANLVTAGGEVGYGLGWSVAGGDQVRLLLPVTGFVANLPANQRIVGETSQASARVIGATSMGLTFLTMFQQTGGSFLPGENLLLQDISGPVIGQVGSSREQPVEATVWHSGKLSGVQTVLKRRVDGVSWIMMVNQSDTGSSFYIKNHAPSMAAIDDVLDGTSAFPSWDLFQ